MNNPEIEALKTRVAQLESKLELLIKVVNNIDSNKLDKNFYPTWVPVPNTTPGTPNYPYEITCGPSS